MKYLKLFEEVNNEYKFFIDNVRYNLLVIDSDENATYKYDDKGEYQLSGPLSVEEYVTEKMWYKTCKFYCNSCWGHHTGLINEIKVFDPATLYDEDPGGPWIKVKFAENGKQQQSPDGDNFHDVEPYNQITVYGEQSELSKEHDKLMQKIVEERDTLRKYNL